MPDFIVNLLRRGLRKLFVSAIGLVICLVWWSIRGGNDNSESMSRIPDKVWEGGAGTMTIETETTAPGRLSVTFSEQDEDGRSLEAWEEFEAGSHSWTIDLPPNTGGYVDLTDAAPEVGNRLRWVIQVDDQVVAEEEQTLHEPLREGWAFGLQVSMDDYSSGVLASD
jgi:hypothetical protein